MPFDKDLIESVLKHADIVKIISSYLSVIKKGKDYVAICPFHDDTNPSMHINPEKQIFKCFVCGTGGSAITFVQKYEHINFMDAVRKVAELSGYSDPRLEQKQFVKKVDSKLEPLYKCTRDLTLYYQYALGTEEGREGLEYFESRHLDSSLRAKYQLGYAFKDGESTIKFLQSKGHSLKTIEDIGISTIYSSGNIYDRNQGRVIFPICNQDGDVVGYSARRLKDGTNEAKYVNSPETKIFVKSNILYNYHIAKEKARIAGYIYVLEGFMDVFALARIGIDSAVAIMGTALTKEHIQMLRKLNVEVRVCLDGDLPGQTATIKIARELTNEGIPFRIVDNVGSTMDPDEILNNEGPEQLRYYLNNLISREDFALNYYKRSNPLKTVEEKKAFVKEFIPILVGVKTQLELDSYLRKIADITGFEAESIRDLVKRAKRSQSENKFNEVMYDFHPERKALKKLENAERELLYQMLLNVSAIKYYEQFIGNFYDVVYRQIAAFVIEIYKTDGQIDPLSVISLIESSDIENADELIREITNTMSETTHPDFCSEELLNNLKQSIQDEKQSLFEKEVLAESMKGKSPLEQARILNEYNRRRAKKELNDEEDN